MNQFFYVYISLKPNLYFELQLSAIHFHVKNCHKKATFLTPEEAQTYLSQLRHKKKSKDQLKPPTNLVASELNDWYSQQRRIQLEEQKKRIEAVGVM